MPPTRANTTPIPMDDPIGQKLVKVIIAPKGKRMFPATEVGYVCLPALILQEWGRLRFPDNWRFRQVLRVRNVIFAP